MEAKCALLGATLDNVSKRQRIVRLFSQKLCYHLVKLQLHEVLQNLFYGSLEFMIRQFYHRITFATKFSNGYPVLDVQPAKLLCQNLLHDV